MTALASKRQTLTDLVTNTNTTAGGRSASESTSLSPRRSSCCRPTLRRANTTFVDLRATLDDLTALVNVSKPATKRLAPFLAALRPLVHDSIPTVRDLRLTIRQPGPNNDLIDLLHKTPKLGNQAKVVVPARGQDAQEGPAGRRVHPALRPRARRLVPRLRPGHEQLRRQRPLRAHPADRQRVLVQRPDQRADAGARGQPPAPEPRARQSSISRAARARPRSTRPDKGNPWRDTDGNLDCNPAQVPPGP